MALKLILMGCLLFCVQNTWAQVAFELQNNRKRQTVHFRLVRNLIVVKLYINNYGPYNFVMDTGVGVFLITDPNLSDSLDIKDKRIIKIAGLGAAEPIEAAITPSVSVNISGIIAKSVAAAILRQDLLGLSNYAGIPIHGLIGYEFFSSFPVKLKFLDSTLTAYKPKKKSAVLRNGFKMPITIEDHKPYLHAKITFINDTILNAKLMVDIGAGHALLLENRGHLPTGSGQKFVPANLGIGLSGPINGSIGRIPAIEIGKYKLTNVITSFPDDDELQAFFKTVKRDGNLGLGILKKFTVLFDYAEQTMYLRPNYTFSEPIEHDMSGMEYYADGEDLNHIIISRVEPGSAAEDAGLEKEDEITSINFTPVDKMTLQEIDNMFRSKNGRGIILEFYRDKKYVSVILTLKNRI
ncbi:MAG: aspartyl protease family protein [Sphingobacteriaceae bacterium]